jgi:hypothetical protein
VLSASAPVVFQPSQRTGSLSCGDNITPGFFESGEHTVQLRASIGCAHSKVAVKISASGKTFDLQGFKIVGAATDQIKGSVGILVAATNVTIVGGGTGSKSGIEYFDYCLMDEGDSDGLSASTLRCFRARSAGIDLASDNVKLNGLLVDLVVAGTNTTTEVPGGIGMHLSGGVSVKDSTVRRAANIGILADGSPDPDGTKHRVVIDGNHSTSRVEQNTGVGIQLEGRSTRSGTPPSRGRRRRRRLDDRGLDQRLQHVDRRAQPQDGFQRQRIPHQRRPGHGQAVHR